MDTGGQPLEHIPRVAESVRRETTAHRHHEQTDNTEGYHRANIIW